MLETQTKRRIDDCRDTLVSKLPDLKAQIEQITIGLIYKFIDDMDKESIDLGGTNPPKALLPPLFGHDFRNIRCFEMGFRTD